MKKGMGIASTFIMSVVFTCILGANTNGVMEYGKDNIKDSYRNSTVAVASPQKLPSAVHKKPADVTEKVRLLGNPFKKDIYARNVWDMQVFNVSIYLGHGNSSNYGPSANAGPVDIISYNVESHEFTNEYTANEEQIDIFKIIDGKIYVPGHDPMDSWALGNYYTLDNGKWNKMRTVPQAIHTYDIAEYKGKLYAATGTNGFSEVVSSEDNGQTWKAVKANTTFISYGMRAYTLFEFKDKLYASSVLTNKEYPKINNFLCVENSNISVIKVEGRKMFPDLSKDSKLLKIVRPAVYKDTLLYIAGEINNDHQNIPLALYSSSEIGESKKVILGKDSSIPYDILVRDSAVYVLTNEKTAEGKFTISVYKSGDLKSWDELFYFTSDAFARSFEEIGGDFYLGLGCDTVYMPQSTGNILKVSHLDY